MAYFDSGVIASPLFGWGRECKHGAMQEPAEGVVGSGCKRGDGSSSSSFSGVPVTVFFGSKHARFNLVKSQSKSGLRQPANFTAIAADSGRSQIFRGEI